MSDFDNSGDPSYAMPEPAPTAPTAEDESLSSLALLDRRWDGPGSGSPEALTTAFGYLGEEPAGAAPRQAASRQIFAPRTAAPNAANLTEEATPADAIAPTGANDPRRGHTTPHPAESHPPAAPGVTTEFGAAGAGLRIPGFGTASIGRANALPHGAELGDARDRLRDDEARLPAATPRDRREDPTSPVIPMVRRVVDPILRRREALQQHADVSHGHIERWREDPPVATGPYSQWAD